jgi:hypothetical protein
MDDVAQPGSVRVAAAQAVLDRGHGKPLQAVEQKIEGTPQFAVVVPQRTSDEQEWLRMAAAAETTSPDRRN